MNCLTTKLQAVQKRYHLMNTRFFLARVYYSVAREKELSRTASMFLAGFQMFKNNYSVGIYFKD
jgi:hypothetical protein